jgi:hypothetical protein
LAAERPDPIDRLSGEGMIGVSQFYLGDLPSARHHLEHALVIYVTADQMSRVIPVRRSGTESSQTLRWRGLDSNFQYAGAVNLIVALFCSPRAFHRVRTVGGWMIGWRAVQSPVVSYKGRYR